MLLTSPSAPFPYQLPRRSLLLRIHAQLAVLMRSESLFHFFVQSLMPGQAQSLWRRRRSGGVRSTFLWFASQSTIQYPRECANNKRNLRDERYNRRCHVSNNQHAAIEW